MKPNISSDYRYVNADLAWSNAYLWPVLRRVVAGQHWGEKRAFEVGCGNGAIANLLSSLGFSVTAIDPSESGITVAQAAFPHLHLALGDAYEDLAGQYGRFPLVISLEVIEHWFYPRRFIRTFHDLIKPGGVGFLSTPYHGYTKNLALALAGKWDHHLSPLWDGGHIKFFSRSTLGALLREAGFQQIQFIRVGRIPPLAKSLVALVRKETAGT